MTNATTFGKQAATYAKGRPGYPPELYRWIGENSPAHELVWDIGTGSGQAARALTNHFSAVYATDISAEQIAATRPHAHITYKTAPAESSGLAENSVDCMTVATALHWFAAKPFWDEVARVAAKDAFFCAWTYQLPQSGADIHAQFLDPLYALIDPYWADGNRICMAGYTAEALDCPFPVIPAPNFDAGGIWTAQQLVSFTESWSAHFRAREDGLGGGIEALTTRFLACQGDRQVDFKMPISVLAARIPS